MSPPELIWREQCEAAVEIRERLGLDCALDYLVGEKFVDYLRHAARELRYKRQLCPFADRIRVLFESWELASWFERRRKRQPSEHNPFRDPEFDSEIEAELAESSLKKMYLLEDAERWLLRT